MRLLSALILGLILLGGVIGLLVWAEKRCRRQEGHK